MTKNYISKIIIAVVVLLVLAAGYFLWTKNQNYSGGGNADKIEYKNSDYGFSIALPQTWHGYTVSIDKWTGYSFGDELGERPYADGPVVSIHNPLWTAEKPYQDIPIMVFTMEQWTALQSDKFHIGAAPIGPSELGRNAKYVFALPARYNYSFPPGYEEVDQILQGKPLKTF